MTRHGWGVLLLALSSALAGPFGGGGGGPFGSGSPPPATTTTAGLVKLRPTSIGILLSAGAGTSLAVTNVPVATTELVTGNRRVQTDLTEYTQCRLVAQVVTVGNAGSKLCVQVSADESTWTFLDGTADGDCGSEAPQISMAALVVEASDWMTLGSSARGDRVIRLLSDDGDATADPNLSSALLQCR